MADISGILLDLDGVLYMKGKAIRGALDALNSISDAKIPFRCLSNTTRKSSATISENLLNYGFSIPKEHIITPAVAVSEILNKKGVTNCFFLITGDVISDFTSADLIADEENPEAVIIGDAGDNFNYKKINQAFRILNKGALFYALEKDKYWMDNDGLSLSAGPFVKGLEYATDREALLVGKPSVSFFQAALLSLGKNPEETLMVGDDIITDIEGAKNCGMRGALVKTGKFNEHKFYASGIMPDYLIESVTDLPKILGIK
ncbi:MAG: TIGR01458 family HAD-type hydrolase [Methanomicrobiaceae archaeon]|nr:TIGR01458 family HAD-type hydrolase [Methanomicrobiaceae archaeon]